jgi:hypothetical protein
VRPWKSASEGLMEKCAGGGLSNRQATQREKSCRAQVAFGKSAGSHSLTWGSSERLFGCGSPLLLEKLMVRLRCVVTTHRIRHRGCQATPKVITLNSPVFLNHFNYSNI